MTPHPLLRTAGLVAAVWLMAACSGSEPATGTLSADPAACEVAETADRCTVQVSWTSEGANKLQLRAPGGGPDSAVAASGTAAVAVPVGGGPVSLLDGDAVLASLTLSARCAERSTADAAGMCRPVPLQYRDKVYAILAGYPFVVGRERASPVDNRSRLSLAEPMSDCVLGDPQAGSGRIAVVCATDRTGTGPWHRLYLDPTQEALFDDPDRSPVAQPVAGPVSPVPAALAAFVTDGVYFDKGSGLMFGPYVTFGPDAGQSGPGLCPGLPGCVTRVVPLDYYDFLAESRTDYYFSNSREGGLYVVPKEPAPRLGITPAYIAKDGFQPLACRTCPAALTPAMIRAYSHPG